MRTGWVSVVRDQPVARLKERMMLFGQTVAVHRLLVAAPDG